MGNKPLPILIILLLICNLSLNAQSWKTGRIEGEGPIVRNEVNIDRITGFNLGVPATLFLTQSKTQKISIEAQQNIFDNIEHQVKEGHWNIKFDKDVKDLAPIKIYLSLAHLDKIGLGGKARIECTNHFKNIDDLDMGIGGLGEIVFMGDAQTISCSIGGLGQVEMSGSTNHLDINIGGKGLIEALELETNHCDISSAGSGQIEINVKDKLDVSMVGNGKIRYKGSPKVNSSVVGSGDLSKIK